MKALRKYNIKGFSLIELMVVVAIIGILSAIAIPNFQRFQRKARQSEAKSTLGGIYTAEKAFLAEWESYHSDFGPLGVSIDGELRYNAGFAAGNAPCALALNAPACNPIAGRYTGSVLQVGDANVTAWCGNNANCVDISVASGLNGAVAPTESTFTAAAAGDIGGAVSDQWNMNQAKVMTNTVSGID